MKRGATFSSRFLPFVSVKKFWVVAADEEGQQNDQNNDRVIGQELF